jgi:hypothetical protein
MTPTPPSPADKRTSGNPAKQAEINLTVKQQREQKRQEKLAEYQKQLAKRRRSKLVWWVVGITAAVVIIGLIVASIVFAPAPPQEYTPGGEGVEIEGVETYENTTQHVEGTVDYEQSPPAGGPHNAVWVTYNPDDVSGEELATLESHLPSTYVILSPYEGLDAPIAVTNWNHQLKVDSADDERITQFFEEYWRSADVPEPGAACTGAFDAPGKR